MRSIGILALTMVVMGCAVEATDDPAVSQAANQNRVSGAVLETLDASSYTYLRLRTAEGEVWAAVPRARLELGTEVAIVRPQLMSGFESKTLGRRFDKIYFGTLEGQGSPESVGGANPHGSGQAGMGSAGKTAQANATSIDIPRAEGALGRTVAELYAERGDLAGKTVAVRGKVVKYSAGIMNRNWIHLQDGSGDAASGTNDLTVTSSATTAVGETIRVEGTVAVDKDFGAGYRYAVIVEDARLN